MGLTVQDPAGSAAPIDFQACNPVRTAELSSVVAGPFVAADVITFDGSLATGLVVSHVGTTLTFYLTTAKIVEIAGERDVPLLPWNGETITAGGGKSAVVSALDFAGDSFDNDELTQLRGFSETSDLCYVVVHPQKRTRFGPSLPKAFAVEPSGDFATQTFLRETFNSLGGIVRFSYIGPVDAAQLSVAAVRVVPRG